MAEPEDLLAALVKVMAWVATCLVLQRKLGVHQGPTEEVDLLAQGERGMARVHLGSADMRELTWEGQRVLGRFGTVRSARIAVEHLGIAIGQDLEDIATGVVEEHLDMKVDEVGPS